MIITEPKTIFHSFRKLIINLFLLHFCFILLTPLLLAELYLARLGLIIYLSLLIYTGFSGTKKMIKPALYAFKAGCISQLPGILPSLVVIVGILTKHTTPDALDFAAQVWQAPFASLFPFLPRTWLCETPLYYWVTILLSFLLPLFPSAGAFINCKLANQRAKN